MCEFSPKPFHTEYLVPDYEIEMKYDYWSSTNSDYGSTSFVECEIIGMESFHKLNIPLIHLKTRSEKEDQEESDCKTKNNSKTEFDSRSIIEPNSTTPLDPKTISIKYDSTTSNINSGNTYS